ncbi:TetR/AcrR family transcriptional regulator [Actinomycetospora termitidis]|uniref:TetR/AcrR family transcriptional regulator C-terminal domain-containing protein n=1 Tax=Actinomycetospora termitidis TaxID=3053470 RepID=A0ABT7MGB7_9PSEU|nr:TetR/AcrR family transcriptional regulator C-terminal domain-containing protein [Actinomycetospora sp. Odt1-22]MDL5158398.1 TetR/AcrR family transcriptional regulator C-terminal domain-containing protein [Actinomycetospora sp. Odt1-22]
MTSGQVLWEDEAVPVRGPRRALSRDEIAAAAIAVADRDGLEGLSMQRVSAEVGLTKMALYRYVAGKEELEALMVDVAVEEPPAPGELTGTWREQAEEFTRRVDVVWTRHPWIPWATIGERMMGPREVGWVEAAVRIFEPLMLTAQERMDAVSMLFGHLRSTHAAASGGTRPWTADPEGGSTMRDLVARHGDRFPALSAVMSDQRPGSGARYAFGLRCLLDGLEAASARGER